MGWFNRGKTPSGPQSHDFGAQAPAFAGVGSVVAQLSDFGKAAFDALRAGRSLNDPRYSWSNFYGPLNAAFQADPRGTVRALVTAAGTDPYRRYGAYVALKEPDPGIREPSFLALMDEVLDWLKELGFSSGHLNRYEADRWVDTRGGLSDTFDGIIEVAPKSPDSSLDELNLDAGESIKVAAMGPSDLDNQFFIERPESGVYRVYSMREWESGDGFLTRCNEDRIGEAPDSAAMLAALGAYFDRATFWAHPALEPYFTSRRG